MVNPAVTASCPTSASAWPPSVRVACSSATGSGRVSGRAALPCPASVICTSYASCSSFTRLAACARRCRIRSFAIRWRSVFSTSLCRSCECGCCSHRAAATLRCSRPMTVSVAAFFRPCAFALALWWSTHAASVRSCTRLMCDSALSPCPRPATSAATACLTPGTRRVPGRTVGLGLGLRICVTLSVASTMSWSEVLCTSRLVAGLT